MSSDASWPALVLAAGLGTRLRPLSLCRAKAALPVAGRPLIARILDQLRAAGVGRVVINLHHRASTITRIVGDGAAFGLDVRYSWESEVLGSGGGPARALPLLGAERFFILNGDTLCGLSLSELAAAHRKSGAAVTLAGTTADLSRYGALLTDRDGAFTGILPKGRPLADSSRTPWHFVGVQAVDAAAFAGVSLERPSESLRDVYTHVAAEQPGRVRIFPTDAAFHDIGTAADYWQTAMVLTGIQGGEPDYGSGCVVAASATVAQSILWDRVRVGDGAVLSRCIVADDVEIPAGARYDRAVITPDDVAYF